MVQLFACIDCQLTNHVACEEKKMPFCGCRREEQHGGDLAIHAQIMLTVRKEREALRKEQQEEQE